MKHKTVRKIIATCVFWLVLAFGPVLIRLWEFLSPYGAREGTLTFLLVSLTAQAIAAFLAGYAADYFCEDGENGVVLVNSIIATTLMAVLALVAAQGWDEVISDVLAAVVLAYRAKTLWPRRT